MNYLTNFSKEYNKITKTLPTEVENKETFYLGMKAFCRERWISMTDSIKALVLIIALILLTIELSLFLHTLQSNGEKNYLY